MGLIAWLRRDDDLKEMMAQILRISAQQVEVTTRLTALLEQQFEAFKTDGTPPESRHINDEIEADMFTEREDG